MSSKRTDLSLKALQANVHDIISGQVLLMYKLMLNGYKIDERELSGFSEKYEVSLLSRITIATR